MLLKINYILGFRKRPVSHKKKIEKKKLNCIFQIVKNKCLLDPVNQKIKEEKENLQFTNIFEKNQLQYNSACKTLHELWIWHAIQCQNQKKKRES